MTCLGNGTILARFNRWKGPRRRHRERVGEIAITQARDGRGLGHNSSCESGETWLASGYFSS